MLDTLTNDPLLSGSDHAGIHRVDSPDSFTLIADIAHFSMGNPPETDFFLVTGVQYALETFRGGFLVTDSHHNRVLRVSEMVAFDNIVPTGLEVRGNTVFMAEAGPNPHLPEDGKVITFEPNSPDPTELASGAPCSLVDINEDGTFTVIVDSLDRPTSVDFIENTAYVIYLTAEVWKIDNVSPPPYGG